MNNIAQLLKDGQHEEARRACEAALEVNPDSSQLLECMGIALKKIGRAQEAMEYYDKALKIRPNARTWFNRGICVRSMNAKNAHEIAVESYEKAIELDPHFIDPMQNLGNVTSRLGDTAQTLEDQERYYGMSNAAYTRAISVEPDNAQLHANLGDLYTKQRRLTEACAEFNKAVELESGYTQGWYCLGNAYLGLRKYDEAQGAFDKAISLEPDSGWAMRSWINKGVAFAEQSLYEDALSCFFRAAKLKPADFSEFYNLTLADAYYNIAFIYRRQGKQEESRKMHRLSLDYRLDGDWFYEPKKQMSGPAARNEEYIPET